MQILIDADACHVLKDTERIARRYGISCTAYANHSLHTRYACVVHVDAGHDAADFAILNSCMPGDIVVTADGGLAAMAMAKQAVVLNPYGGQYTDANIMAILDGRSLIHRKPGRQKRKKPQLPCPLDRTMTYASCLEEALNSVYSKEI